MSSKEKNILFALWDGGTGHLTRTMSVASEAADQGWRVGVISSVKHAAWIHEANSDFEVMIVPNRNPTAPPPPQPFPVYSHAFNHAQRLCGCRFNDTDWLRQNVHQLIDTVRVFNPQVIYSDYHDLIKIAAQHLEIPMVGLTKTTGNPNGYAFGGWVKPPDDIKLPDCRSSFNQVRGELGLSSIEDERESFAGDISVIPSIPEIDPLRQPSKNSVYVGLLSHWWREQGNFDPIPGSLRKVFSYVGERSRPDYGYPSILAEAILALPDLGFYVAGSPDRYQNLGLDAPNVVNRIQLADFISAPQAIPDSSVVISHGGSGTVTQAISHGVPVVCCGPFNSEQQTAFRWIEQQGAGIVISHSNTSLERRPAPDLGEGVETMGYWHSEINSAQLVAAINEITTNSSYKQNALRLAQSLNAHNGPCEVMSIINQFS